MQDDVLPPAAVAPWLSRALSTPTAARIGRTTIFLGQLAFVLLPVVLAWSLAAANRTNTLFLDDWAYVPLYEKAVHGGLTMHDFFGGYLEHRLAVARAIAIVTMLWSKGDVRWQPIVAFVAMTLTWVNMGLLLRRARGCWSKVWLPWGLVGWVMFCPVQWQEFLWPSCHMDTLPLLFLTTALLVMARESVNVWVRLVLCAACAWLATYSFAAGLSLWVLVPLAVLCGPGLPEPAQRKLFLSVWSALALVVLFLYFHDLKNEVEAPFAYGQGHEDTMTHSVAAVLRSPEKGVKFALTLVGSNFARGIFGPRQDVALAMGGAVFAAFALGLLALRRQWSNLAARHALVPLAIVALYGICVSGMVASGRAWASKDVGGALNNRYACFSTAFIAGVVALIAAQSGAKTAQGAQRTIDPHAWLSVAAAPLGSALSALLLANWFYGADMMRQWHFARLRSAVDVHFAPLLGQAQDRGHDAQNIRLANDRSATMDKLGFLWRPLAKTLDLSQFQIKHQLDAKLGVVTGTERELDRIIIRGFALWTMHGRPVDAVLVTYDDGGSRGRQIVEVVLPDNYPAFYATSTIKDLQYVVLDDYRPRRFGQWTATVKRDMLPKNTRQRIECWALNFENMTVMEIGEGFTIMN